MEIQPKEGEYFVALWERYRNKLTNGQRAELRRIKEPEDLRDIPAFYRLLAGRKPDRQLLRVVYALPYADHQENAKPVGAILAKAGIKEARMFQIVRSTEPNDLIYFRRILQQAEPKVNWNQFGRMLYFWGDRSKHNMLEDFFMGMTSGVQN